MTQLALDVLFSSIGPNLLDASSLLSVQDSLQACDPSESILTAAPQYLESVYGDPTFSRAPSRAATPMIVRDPSVSLLYQSPVTTPKPLQSRHNIPCTFPNSATPSPKSVRLVSQAEELLQLRER